MSYTFSLDLVAATAQTLGCADAAARASFLATGQGRAHGPGLCFSAIK